MKTKTPSLKIGLLENSYHSLKRGYETWNHWKDTQDPWFLKESIIWVHHGIELGLKQLVVQTNEFLIFENVTTAVERLGILRKIRGMENAGVLDLFDHDEKVMSVGFKNLIDRAAVTLNIPELNGNAPLRLRINDLTKYRNKVVHFSVELDIAEVSNLLSEILDPLLEVLEREVKNEDFKSKYSPEIRKIARPVQDFMANFRYQIVNDAIKATLNALPPKGNRKAGIVWQIHGSGLGLSIVSYVAQARLTPGIRDNHIVILVDRVDLAHQIQRQLSNLRVQSDPVQIIIPHNKVAFVETLQSTNPKIIVSTIQKLSINTIATNNECLVIGYDLRPRSTRISVMFPNAIRILFTSYPLEDLRKTSSFGDLVAKYSFKQAIDDGLVIPIMIEERHGVIDANHLPYVSKDSDSNSQEFTNSSRITDEKIIKLAQDIIQHFDLRQKKWAGKGVIIIPDLKIANALAYAITTIRDDWHLDREFSVLDDSDSNDLRRRDIILHKFQDPEDSLVLLITKVGSLLGTHNPLIHTAYVTCHISGPMQYQLFGKVSRFTKGKEDGLVVNYTETNWDMEITY